jgi:acetylornithine deacetylase/succinyl-diaminopimelate desuccinylase-like protein
MDHNPLIGDWERAPYSGDLVDGWIHGRGAMDDKGGIVAALAAVRALQRSGLRLAGDVIVAPVAGHKHDGIGTRVLIDSGIRPTWCVNTENTGNEIIHACVGVVKMRISTYNQPIHFHAVPELRGRFFNPVEQLALVIQALGPSHSRPSWLRYEQCPELPDYPQSGYMDLRSDYRKTGWCHLDFQVRTVPGHSRETVLQDVNAVLERLRGRHPKLVAKVEPVGIETPPMLTPRDDRLITALDRAYREANGEPTHVGSRGRLGSIGDGQLFAAAGVPSVLFGPGTSEIFDQWPTPNEKIRVDDIVASAKAMALLAVDLCGPAI